MRKFLLAAGLSLAAVIAGVDARAGQTCTDGVDCYCDCVRGANRGDGFASAACATKNVPVDSAVLMCEDFESRNLTENVGAGAGAPNFGPWYDVTGSPSGVGRGFNSYWTRTYGSVGSGCSWHRGEPANPQYGITCGAANCFAQEWSAGNPWGANQYACIDIMRNGEFDDELPTNPEPTIPGGGSGVLDGRQSIAHRVPRGDGGGAESPTTGGFHGTKSFGRVVTNIGITQAMAFPTNIEASRVMSAPWKFNETSGNDSGTGYEGWPVGNSGVGWLAGGTRLFPFAGYVWTDNTPACEALDDESRALVGQKQCNHSLGLHFGPNLADYDQPRDFPFGTWGCIQSHFYDMNTSNAKMKIWYNGKLIVDLDRLDGAKLLNPGYNAYHFNHYANYNQHPGAATTQVTYRYEDNVHLRQGAPVSCQQIGFTSLAPATPPTPNPEPPAGLGKPGTPTYTP